MQKLIEQLEQKMEALRAEVRDGLPVWALMDKGAKRDAFWTDLNKKGEEYDAIAVEVKRLKKEFQTATPSADK